MFNLFSSKKRSRSSNPQKTPAPQQHFEPNYYYNATQEISSQVAGTLPNIPIINSPLRIPQYVDLDKINWSDENIDVVNDDTGVKGPIKRRQSISAKKYAEKTHSTLLKSTVAKYEEEESEDNEKKNKTNVGSKMHVKIRSSRFGSKTSLERFNSGLIQRQSKSPRRPINNLKNDPTKLNCLDRIFLQYFQPKKAFFLAAFGVNRFMLSLEKEMSPIIKHFEWPKLPGKQHVKARGYNYVSHLMWILSYAAGTAYAADDDKEEFYKDVFEEIVIRCESAGILLQDFIQPVNDLEKMFMPFEEMARVMEVELKLPQYFGVNSREIFDDALMPEERRFKIRDYLKLKIYTRDTKDDEWVEFGEVRYQEQMSRVRLGLMDAAAKIKSIVSSMSKIVTMLKHARGNGAPSNLTLLPHVVKMEISLKRILRAANFTTEDERAIKDVFEMAQLNVQYIIDQAICLMTNMWEIVLMARLTYSYLHQGPNSCGTMLPMDEVIKPLMVDFEKMMRPDIDYSWRQFYDVECASLLRKVPIFIGNTVEMAIHLEGFINPQREVATTKPSRRSSVTHERNSTHQTIRAPETIQLRRNTGTGDKT